jgi:CCR4-NOT transcription complex subunit 6
VDGCATFWRRSRFALTQEFSIEFNDIARHEVSGLGVDEAEARKFMNRLSRDNIAQIVVLEALPQPGQPPRPRNQRQSICISNTHLYSNHQRADVKLWQTLHLIRELRNFVVPRDLPLMICGDFNSEPHSAVYELLFNGMVGSNHPELDATAGVRILPDLQHIGHDLELHSALSSALGMEPNFTNYTAKFKGTLDYICYSPSRLRVLSSLDLPQEDSLRYSCGEGLPAAAYPSDHLMICCDVAFFSSGTGSILNQNLQSGQRGNFNEMGMRSMMRSDGGR